MAAPDLPILDLPDERIPMPDGARLAARIWRPAGAGRYPAILEMIPYRKRDGTLMRDERMHPVWAAAGYACIRVDLRGSGESDGVLDDEYSAQELQDACDVIAWAAAQPWCSGAVGMMGKSWGGFNCLQTAFLRPPALKAVLSVCSTTDRFADDIHFKGGTLLGENIGWGAVMLSYQSRSPDPALRQDWHEVWRDRLRAMPFLAPRWAAHQARDAYWRHGSVCEDWDRVAVPVLAIGGWADNYMNTVAALVEHMPGRAWGIVGPWVHQYPHTAVPGPRIDFVGVALRWWDRWLKGVANGVEDDPRYRAWMMDSAPPDASAAYRPGVWVAEAALPGRSRWRKMALGAGGVLGGTDAPGAVPPLVIDSPQDIGLEAGEFFPMGLNAEMAGDQRGDDERSVTFDTAPVAEPLAMLGAARLRLRLTSDAPRAHLVARLCDVAPDGRSVRIAHGILNLCHRDDMHAPTDVPVGTPFDVTLTLDQCAYRLAAGHRLRLALSTTYWPFVWPARDRARLAVVAGALDVPVHPGPAQDECAFDPPRPLPPASFEALHPDRAERRIERDLSTGSMTLAVTDAGGAVRHAHGLEVADSTRERWTIHPDDPLTARADLRWTQSHRRGDIHLTTEVTVAMTCTAQEFRMQASLVAQENGAEVMRRDWDDRVPRTWA
jgi:hypothetical protein